MASVPSEIRDKRYISLTTFRKNGQGVPTPVWFAEQDGKLVIMTRSDSGKYKRIRNNPSVRIAPCTISGKITGPDFPARASILPATDSEPVRKAIRAKYWLARLPFLWRKTDAYLAITM